MRTKKYQVVASRAQMVEYSDGRVVNYPPGAIFDGEPKSKTIITHLKNNAIRELSAQELTQQNS